MTNQKKAILLIIILIAVFVAAFFGYRTLSGNSFDRQNAGSDREAGMSSETPQELPPAEDFTIEDAEGGQVFLSDYFGKPVVVNFWASWCPPCKGEMPYFQSAYEKYGDRVTFLMVNLTDGDRETKESAQAFLQDAGYTFPVFYDTQGVGMRAYNLMSIPQTVLITADGMVYAQQTGSFTEHGLDALMERFLESTSE